MVQSALSLRKRLSRCTCRRSDAEGLQKLVDGIESNGGSASGHMLNAVEEGAIEKLVEEVEQIGPIEVVLFNLGGSDR